MKTMRELTVQLMFDPGLPLLLEVFNRKINGFAESRWIKLNLHLTPWEKGWAELMKTALYRWGPDVSEVGTSWVEGLVNLQALRPFTSEEVELIRGNYEFLPASWDTAYIAGDPRVWSIPWMADTRLTYYRLDIFEKADVDPERAFSSHETFLEALEKLARAEVEIPLAIPTAPENPTLHVAASWVWATGGEFMSPDGQKVLFNEPEAVEGFCRYFDLYRYIAPSIQGMGDAEVNPLFRKGRVAILISGQWVLNSIRSGDAAPEVLENLGVAPVPGVPFVGGGNLVIWQHARYPDLAIETVSFLTSLEMQETCFKALWMLPTRLETLKSDLFEKDEALRVIRNNLLRGKAFKGAYMWGIVEDGLCSLIASIWNTLFAKAEAGRVDLRQMVSAELDKLATAINSALYDRFWKRQAAIAS
ncbi:MAG: extracellular solute-binding protein [Anaerolineae bacterium]|nr:extracellular solute-binding protein [Anaerolineae bacterium]